MRVSVGDVELYVHERGEGRPLVALHGGPGLDGSVWFPGLDRIAGQGLPRRWRPTTAATAARTPGIRRGGPCRRWPTTSRR